MAEIEKALAVNETDFWNNFSKVESFLAVLVDTDKAWKECIDIDGGKKLAEQCYGEKKVIIQL